MFFFQSVTFFLFLSLASLLALLLLEVANEALAGDGLALEALPDALWHPVEVCAEQVIRLLTRAAVYEVTRVLALEAILRIL